MFKSFIKIDDSLENIVKYFVGNVDFVTNSSKNNKGLCPLQLDVCIAVNPLITVDDEKMGINDDSSDDDDEEDEDQMDDHNYKNRDYIGDIKNKLISNELRYIEYQFDEEDDGEFKARFIVNLLNKFKEKYKIKKTIFEYLHKKRMVLFIDRRKSNTEGKLIDKLILYEPYISSYTRDIPNDAVPEWYFSSSKTCLLPNIKYSEQIAIGTSTEYDDDKDQKWDQDINIGSCTSTNGSLLTFSFHIKAQDAMKCYLFYNGQCIRFLPEEDIKKILPYIFNMEFGDNKEYMNNHEELDSLVGRIKDKGFVDSNFDTFEKMFPRK